MRIDVEPGGCCGSTYVFRTLTPREQAVADDQRFGCDGAWLFVSQNAAQVLSGATLDWSGRIRPPRFRVLRNPNTASTCPCRRSFGEDWPGPGNPSCRSYEPMPWDADFKPPSAWLRQTHRSPPGAEDDRGAPP